MTPAERSRLEALVERWPDDHGDPPDTEYQRGYMAACRDCADELAAELAGAEQETEPCPTISSLASHPITITITDIRPGKLDLPPVDEPTPSPIEPAVHQKQIATDALDPAVVAELERLVDVSASPLNIGDYVCGNWPAILAALRQGTAPAMVTAGWALPPDAGICADDLDECTVTLALSSEAEVREARRALPARRRVRLIQDEPDEPTVTDVPKCSIERTDA